MKTLHDILDFIWGMLGANALLLWCGLWDKPFDNFLLFILCICGGTLVGRALFWLAKTLLVSPDKSQLPGR